LHRLNKPKWKIRGEKEKDRSRPEKQVGKDVSRVTREAKIRNETIPGEEGYLTKKAKEKKKGH